MSINVEFWGAANEVTGSCHLITFGNVKILVDCGLIQGSPADERRNREPFPFSPEDIDAVLLTHAHLDHSGRLPLLFKYGFRGPVYAHSATRDLCCIMLRDAAYLNEKEAEWENRKRSRKHMELISPLYDRQDVERVIPNLRPLEYSTKTPIIAGLDVCFNDAGHILGSSIIECFVNDGKCRRKLVFSGDLGHLNAPILRDPEKIRDADLVVMESTYGNRLHRDWRSTWDEMKAIITSAGHLKGNLLIPAFTIGRTQELLYAFAKNYETWRMARWQIFLDSPMAIAATDVYSRYVSLFDADARMINSGQDQLFSLSNLHYSQTAEQSMRINNIRSGAIIIAGSGMCTGGRIRHHLKHNIWRRECHVLIVGFQARGTIGRALVEGARNIRLWGEWIRVSAHVHTVGGFSAHADSNGLQQWYGHFNNRPPVALVHGEPESIEALVASLRLMNAERVIIPRMGEKVDLTGSGWSK
ncbi:MAG: MBL fold metallo-hydrolase RNA specificity domain-containing protein [Gammaproteobacteria bacterium]